jgi:hypothetical protein
MSLRQCGPIQPHERPFISALFPEGRLIGACSNLSARPARGRGSYVLQAFVNLMARIGSKNREHHWDLVQIYLNKLLIVRLLHYWIGGSAQGSVSPLTFAICWRLHVHC